MVRAGVAELVAGVESGDIGAVRAMLDASPELVHKDLAENNEHRALHFAVLRRDAAMVRLLLDAGADARQGIWPHRDATTAFAIARDREYSETVALIEEAERKRSKSPVAVSESEEVGSPIEQAIAAGDGVRVRELVEADATLLNPHNGLLTVAVKEGQLEMVKLLLDLGFDVDERVNLLNVEQPVESWGSPLWHAALENEQEIAKLLLDRGADANANVYASGWPLRNAWGHEDGVIKNLLLARGARMHAYMVAELHDVEGARPFLESNPEELVWSAGDHGCAEILEMALPKLDWPLADKRWHWVMIQPIRGATEVKGHFKCMEILLKRGIDPNVSRYGATPLHFAAGYRGHVSDESRARFARMLIDAGASLTMRDDLLKSTALGWACRWGRQKMAEVLVARGASVDEPDTEAWARPRAWSEKMATHIIRI